MSEVKIINSESHRQWLVDYFELDGDNAKFFLECYEWAKKNDEELFDLKALKKHKSETDKYSPVPPESFGQTDKGKTVSLKTYNTLTEEQKQFYKHAPCAARYGKNVLVQVKRSNDGKLDHAKYPVINVDQYLRSPSFGLVRQDVGGSGSCFYLTLYHAIVSYKRLEHLVDEEWTGFADKPLLDRENLPKTPKEFVKCCREFTAQIVQAGGPAAEFITHDLARSDDNHGLPNCILMCVARECAKKKRWGLLSKLILFDGGEWALVMHLPLFCCWAHLSPLSQTMCIVV